MMREWVDPIETLMCYVTGVEALVLFCGSMGGMWRGDSRRGTSAYGCRADALRLLGTFMEPPNKIRIALSRRLRRFKRGIFGVKCNEFM